MNVCAGQCNAAPNACLTWQGSVTSQLSSSAHGTGKLGFVPSPVGTHRGLRSRISSGLRWIVHDKTEDDAGELVVYTVTVMRGKL